MARGDPIFARVDISLLFDPRIRRLKNGAHKWFYLACYLSAVEARSETLPRHFDIGSLADRAQIDIRSAKIACKNAVEIGLLEETPEGLIRVVGVRQNHLKLSSWQEDNPSPQRADTGGHERREEERENKPASPPHPVNQKLFPNEILKMLEELRTQKSKFWNKHAFNGKLPADQQKEYSRIVAKIAELERKLRE